MVAGSEPGSALKKALIITGVALVLLVPLAMLRELVSERTELREQAVQSVARGWGGRQMLSGPILALPVSRMVGNQLQTRDWYVLPESLNLDVDITVQPERRKLGIYEVPVYVAKVHATGQFDVAHEVEKLAPNDDSVRVHVERARLLLPIADPRGVRDINASNNPLTTSALEPSNGFPIATLAAPVRLDAGLAEGKRSFDLTLEIAGTESLQFLPFARASRVAARGNWPSPGFASGFLPLERHIAGGRFDAVWQILALNRSYGSGWMENDVPESTLRDSAFGVELVQPVDLYQQVARAVKYAGLFIGLSFLALFLWEHLARRAVHPIQYALMGLALSVFFLLVLALSEYVGFAVAYSLAALALCSLLGVYLAGALDSRAAGGSAASMFAALYALLYLLVTSDDYALLAGALGLFGVLAGVMVLTRKVNWYAPQAKAYRESPQ